MLDALVAGIIAGNTYALIALGVSLIFGVADLINFAQGSIFAVGVMTGWWMLSIQGWPLPAGIVGVVLVTGVLGLLIEGLALRPLVNAPPIAPLLSTVAVGLILDRVLEIVFSPETRRFQSVLPTSNFSIGRMHFGWLDLAILATSIGSMVLLWGFLKYTRLGRAVRATAQDRDAARQMGVSVERIQGLSFAVSSALAGVGGLLIGMYYGNVRPSIGFDVGLSGFTAAVLGGLGSLPGAVIGGLLLGVAESLGVTWFGGSARQLVSFAVLLAVLWLRPNGLLGKAGVMREPLTGSFFGRAAGFVLKPWMLAVGLVLIGVVLPVFGNDYLLQSAGIVAVFATLALSLTLISGTAGQVSLGQAGFLAVGAYALALLTTQHGWGFWPALIAAALLSALVSAVAVAPAIRLTGHYVSIATLAIGSMIVAVALNWESLTRGPLGVFGIPAPTFFGQDVIAPRDFYLLAGALMLVCCWFVWRLQGSHLGLAWRGIREDETAARSIGVSPSAYKGLVFAAGGMIVGVAGALMASQYTFISPDVFTFQVSLLALTMVVMGGMSSIPGAILGAIILVGLPELFRPLQDARILAYGIVLLLLVRFRPQGLLGIR